MPRIRRLSAEQRANLVAYLDGELSPEEAEDIEEVVASNPVARHDVESLDNAWKMLDHLPQVAASDAFTQRTLSKIRIDEARLPTTWNSWFGRAHLVFISAIWILVLGSAAAFGFLTTYSWLPTPDEELIDDLPVIQQLDAYESVEDIEFLRALQRSGLMDDEQ